MLLLATAPFPPPLASKLLRTDFGGELAGRGVVAAGEGDDPEIEVAAVMLGAVPAEVDSESASAVRAARERVLNA